MPQNDSKQAELKVIKFKKFFLLHFQVRSPSKDLNNEQISKGIGLPFNLSSVC